jgi:RNA polymerase sigma factor (sigma-70 family)
MPNATDLNKAALSLMPAVRNLLATMGARGESLDDACQDAFVLLVSYVLPKYDGRGKLSTHALSMVKKRYIGSRTQGAARFESTSADAAMAVDMAECPHGISVFERAIEAQNIRAEMEALSDRERALLMAFQESESWGEAGRAIGVSNATVSRMRASIKAKLS